MSRTSAAHRPETVPLAGAPAAKQRLARRLAAETGGWPVHVTALALAPLLVPGRQYASGIAVLALLVVHGQPSRLSIRERLAVGSRCSDWFCSHCRWSGQSPPHTHPHGAGVVIWHGRCRGRSRSDRHTHPLLAGGARPCSGAPLLRRRHLREARFLGESGWSRSSAGCLLRGRHRCAPAAFQHGSALTAAGIATLVTNAVPIAAGFVLFDEALPPGIRGRCRIAAFA